MDDRILACRAGGSPSREAHPMRVSGAPVLVEDREEAPLLVVAHGGLLRGVPPPPSVTAVPSPGGKHEHVPSREIADASWVPGTAYIARCRPETRIGLSPEMNPVRKPRFPMST